MRVLDKKYPFLASTQIHQNDLFRKSSGLAKLETQNQAVFLVLANIRQALSQRLDIW